MAYKTLLTHVQSDPKAGPRLACAAALARDLDCTFLGLGAEMIPPSGASDPYGILEGEWIVAMRDQLEKNLDAAEAMFEAAAKDLPHDWVRMIDLPGKAVARAARAADIIVAGGAPLDGHDNYRACDIGELVITAGRPVLVAPPGGGHLKGDRIVVAWKDSREARRAVSDALPLLQRAQEVVVLEVFEKDGAEAAEYHTSDVVKALARHGVQAHARVTEAAEDSVCRELNLAAVAIGADLIVSGGYGHNRMSEWVFGGVTRTLLSDPERFVLLSH
jgi:nucleotide-binding universal stress UspA family protein